MRRLFFGLCSAVVIAVLLWTGWWVFLIHRLSARLDEWAAARRAEGWTVSLGGRHYAGWPAVARLVLSDVALSGAGPLLPAQVDWRAARLDVDLAPIAPSVLVLRPHGRQEMAFAGWPGFAIEGASEVRLDLSRLAPPVPISFAGRELRIAPQGGGASASVSRASAEITIDPSAKAERDALAAQFSIGRIELPQGRSWPLGEVVQAASGDFGITGPVPGPGEPEQRARLWQQAGGSLRVRAAALHWGPLEATATGRAGLDADLQPTAELVVHATGFAQAMDVLAAHHVMPDHAALVAKAVLSLLAEVPAGGGTPVLTVPLSLQDGIVAAHGIPLVRVAPLAWAGG
ncbi:MAG TPA: DUF2125 domain-containing protein [Acetobacteraceae bacterium]|nr:DUF2125 domain-containing protein [Acetobacteraceae bacterium]